MKRIAPHCLLVFHMRDVRCSQEKLSTSLCALFATLSKSRLTSCLLPMNMFGVLI